MTQAQRVQRTAQLMQDLARDSQIPEYAAKLARTAAELEQRARELERQERDEAVTIS
jgi:hypothetical protein